MRRHVIAIGVLALLLTGRGGRAAASPADDARALAVAQAGLLDAEAKLKAAFPKAAFGTPGLPSPWMFWGASVAENAPPPAGFPAADAANPSFAVEVDGDPADADPTPRQLRVDGALRGFSGAVAPGTYATNGDHYALKISDLSGRLHVNDGVDGGPSGSVSQNLRRLLNALGQVVSVGTLGDRVLAGRPAGGYATLEALKPVIGDADYARTRPFLTAHAWLDRDVANPVPLSATKAAEYPVTYYRGSPAAFRVGHGVDSLGNPVGGLGLLQTTPPQSVFDTSRTAVFGLDTLHPQWIEIVSRAPVNVNAAPREVLVALLADLKGIFLADRRRNNPRWQGDLLLSLKRQHPYAPRTISGGDEIGFLTETVPISLDPLASVSAWTIADEILACRARRASANFNYASPALWWAGPFRTWHQFNAFVDHLVAIGILRDDRSIHVRWEEESADPTGYGALVPCEAARRHAVLALADVLKANFNPNLHLNELNPDANLYLRVDKTDLVVNSTELCFLPTGWFEVESAGKVVRPSDGAADALAAADNALAAQVTARAVVRLYDLHRESTQRHFYAGAADARSAGFETNNDKTVEVGPEPDNGVFPGNLGAAGAPDNEWSGYVALPTSGSVWHAPSAKSKNTLVKTLDLPAASHASAAMHGHFTLDADLCHHALAREEIASRSLADENVSNYPDLVGGAAWPQGGPYTPSANAAHRLARSFRRALGAPDPPLTPYPPSDLRIDGLYAERHAAPAYLTSTSTGSLWNFSGAKAGGTVSFWVKPSFFPEITGKIRKLWDLGRYHDMCGQNLNVWPFETVFLPSHYNYMLSEATGPKFWHNNMGQFQPSSMYFGSVQWHSDSVNGSLPQAHQFGRITSCLNHVGHDDEGSKASPLRAHRWMNVAFSWNLDNTTNGGVWSKLLVNQSATHTPFSYSTMTGWSEGGSRMYGFERHAGNEFNHMRLGSPSRIANAAMAAQGFRGNHSADFTVDELYVWTQAVDLEPLALWSRGRYASPHRETSGEAVFRSGPIALAPAAGAPGVRLLGAAWTWYGEDVDPSTGDRRILDYAAGGAPGSDLGPRVDLTLLDGALPYGPYGDDGYSPVLDVGGAAPFLVQPADLRYRVHLRLTSGSFASVLLATPVFDDVTLYWDDGRPSAVVGPVVTETASIPAPGGGGGGGGGGCGATGLEGLLFLLLRRRRVSPKS